MARNPRRRSARRTAIAIAGGIGGIVTASVSAGLLALVVSVLSVRDECAAPAVGSADPIVVAPPGSGRQVGATEYGGPGDPSSGSIGASGANLLAHPDSYAELGGYTFQTATAMGGLPYMTPLRITWAGRSAIAYKRDFGFGGGPIGGLPRVIDLWWQLAGRLGIPYDGGLWSGPVEVQRAPGSGSAQLLGQVSADLATLVPISSAAQDPAVCAPGALAGVPLAAGDRARLLPDGSAAAPAGAPLAVKEIVAAGNQIIGKPYVYGGGHGLALSQVAPGYDCSSSVEHLLFGAHLLPMTYDAPSGQLESFGAPGLGQWVTLYANPDHVFMYVAGLRWDTHNAAGPDDGSTGIGWHPMVRSAAGFVPRHPVGL
jgi:hypothetical protein